MDKPKILFISRAYPPIVGGIENQNYELGKWLGKIAEVKIIANKRGKKVLPFFLFYATVKALFSAGKYDVILLGDGVLSVVGWKLKLFYKKPVICVVHGLDLTYKNLFYQKLWINIFLKKLDKLIAVGNETVRVALQKGFPQEKITFIPNGIDTDKFYKPCDRQKLARMLDEDVVNNKFILTSGRLAKRKGVAWFIENVLPKLPENIFYVVAGDGPDKKNILETIQKTQMQSRVKILGRVNDETRDILFNTCDLFVQPNIKIEGDMEGFGLSVIEAASCQLPVIASNLEGLKDAIKDGQNGFLVEPYDVSGYTEKINELLSDDNFRKSFGEKARLFVVENYGWEKISRKYLEEIKLAISN